MVGHNGGVERVEREYSATFCCSWSERVRQHAALHGVGVSCYGARK